MADDEQLRMLASDADRARYADVLGDAYAEGRLTREEYDERLSVAMSARTYGDLLPVLADLPHAGTVVPLPPQSVQPAPLGVPAQPAAAGWLAPASEASSSAVVAIFGGSSRKGQWVVPTQLTAFAMFGGVELDLTSAWFAGDSCEIIAVAVMGGVEITVPDGLKVQIDGIGIFGGFDQKAAGPGQSGAPTLRVRGVALFGGVEVKRKGRALPGGADRPALPSQ